MTNFLCKSEIMKLSRYLDTVDSMERNGWILFYVINNLLNHVSACFSHTEKNRTSTFHAILHIRTCILCPLLTSTFRCYLLHYLYKCNRIRNNSTDDDAKDSRETYIKEWDINRCPLLANTIQNCTNCTICCIQGRRDRVMWHSEQQTRF
jgi:hypothetical protein